MDSGDSLPAESGRAIHRRDKLRVAVIGTGAFAQACHIPELRSHPDVELVAICGRDLAHTRALAGRFGIAVAVTDAARLSARDDIDAVTICSPNMVHCEQAVAAFANDKHVFCEKPLAAGLDDARMMVDAARTSRRVGQVAFTFRHLYGIEELRRRVRAGQIGEPLFLRARHEYADRLQAAAPSGWRHGDTTQGGGVLLDTGAHLMDLARFLMGPISSVHAELKSQGRPGVASDDATTAWFRYASGATGQWFASRIAPPPSPNFVQVVGREGTLEAAISRGGFDTLRRLRPGAATWEEIDLPPEAAGGQQHALGRMMRSFVDGCLRGELADGAASFEDGFAVQRILAAAAEAAAGSRLTPLDPVA